VAKLAEGNIKPRVEILSNALKEAARQVGGGRTSPEEDLRQDSAERKNS
jgi:hypothetical protein